MAYALLSRFFPVPKLLKPRIVGLDLSNDSVKFVDIDTGKGGLFVRRFGEAFFPAGTIIRGEIKNRRAFLETLIAFKKKHGIEEVSVSLPEEKAYVFTLEIPEVKRSDLGETIEFQMEEHIPLSPEQIVFDYDIVSKDKERGVLHASIGAMPKSAVQMYYDALSEAGFYVFRFEPEAVALARALIPPSDPGTYMVVDLGNTRTVIGIVERGIVSFNTTLDFGGAHITEAIRKEKGVSFDEAEKIKTERGLGYKDTSEGGVFSAALSSLAVLKDEILKFYSYWNERASSEGGGKKEIHHIIFVGGGSSLKGFSEFLAGYINVPFQVGDVWTNVINTEEKVPGIHRFESLRYGTAIGLSLANFIRR